MTLLISVNNPLIDLRLELLRNCPLLCEHCSAFAAANNRIQLPLQRVLAFIDEFVTLGGQRLTLTGGEPLIYDGLFAVLERAKSHRLVTRIFSAGVRFENGERISMLPEFCNQLQEFTDIVAFSLYSMTPEIHDSITRIPGSFDLTVQSIRNAAKAGIQVDIHFVPTKKNYGDLANVVTFGVQVDAKRISVLRFVPHGRGAAFVDSLALDNENYQALHKEVTRLREQHDIKIEMGSAHSFLEDESNKACRAGIDKMVVEATGRVLPCSAFAGFNIEGEVGDFYSHTLTELWQQSTYIQQVRDAQAVNRGCSGCLAQKTLASGQINPLIPDPLLELPMLDSAVGQR